jgi:hypothetical protein
MGTVVLEQGSAFPKEENNDEQPINGYFPVLIQSRFGTHGNFELVTTYHGANMPEGALAHFRRNNDDPPAYPWSLPNVFGTNAGPPALVSPTLIESNFGSPGTLEVICLGVHRRPRRSSCTSGAIPVPRSCGTGPTRWYR